jgi:thiamine-phosphate pyrophosphorylase
LTIDHRLPSRLHAIIDYDVAARFGWTVPALAEAYLEGGARFLQVRAKHATSAEYLSLCEKVVARARASGSAVIVNDRADIARLSGAAGVHVGQDDLPVPAVRSIVGPDAIVGFSTHSVDQAQMAGRMPIDYVAIGPIFGTATKETGYSALGLDVLRRVVSAKPIVAIGGVTLDRAKSVIDAGAASVAVISDLLATGSPSARVREYLSALQ